MAPRTQHPAIRGRFRITTTELWDREALDLVEPAFIRFGDERDGEFRMIAVQGDLDCRHGTRDGRPAVEFTWEGMDELDEAHGRGWVVLKEDGTLSGYLHFHRREGVERQGDRVVPLRETRDGYSPSKERLGGSVPPGG